MIHADERRRDVILAAVLIGLWSVAFGGGLLAARCTDEEDMGEAVATCSAQGGAWQWWTSTAGTKGGTCVTPATMRADCGHCPAPFGQ